MNTEYDYLFKLLLIGDSGVGKSCLLLRFADDTYTESYISTIGVDFKIRTIQLDGKTIKLQIWDTAGQERFRSMAPLYYRGAVAAILVCSITDEGSFEKLKEWVRELQANVSEPLVLAIACNKADMAEHRVVSYAAAAQYAASIGALIFETSAKQNTGVSELFHEVARKLVASRVRDPEHSSNGQQTSLPDPLSEAERRRGCC
mmetsp:Transcript_42750/g.103850  ORF Transcript_42750/g.103850 Transcript_42750/m.103850 type:complete len:203 (+) Transcript_42750:41-649(+)